MWSVRADAARREITALARDGMDAQDLLTTVLGTVARTVPFEQACWAVVDPASLVMTTVVNVPYWPVPPEGAVRFAESETSGTEPNRFAVLSRRAVPVARISDAPYGEVRRSVRLNELLASQGFVHELRAAFVTDRACWAVGGLFRERGRDFGEREVEFLAAVSPVVGAVTRASVRGRTGGSALREGPVVVLVGPRGDVRATTAGALAWLTAMQGTEPGRLGIILFAVAARARAADSGTARARMRDPVHGWVVLEASRLITGEDPVDVVVTVRPVTADEKLGLLLSAYAVTAREQEVCRELLAGRSTADIADRLFISPYTVQDHVKALLQKVGVRSRGELVAVLS